MRPFPAFSRICPSCRSNDVGVIETRTFSEENNAPVRRRRKCKTCNHRWTTYEISEESMRQMRAMAEHLRDAAISCNEAVGSLSFKP